MTPYPLINRRRAFTTAGLGLFGTSLAVSTLAAEASAATAPHDLDVRAFGAKGDGAADDAAALFKDFWQWKDAAPAGTDTNHADPLKVFRGFWNDGEDDK